MEARNDVAQVRWKKHKLSLVDGKIEAQIIYDPAIIHIIKTGIDPRREWNPETKVWTFPAEPIVLKRLSTVLGIHPEKLPPELADLAPRPKQKQSPPEVIEALRESWPGQSRPYRHQLNGLHELLLNKWWLLAWEMGTGKSAVVAARLRLGMDRGDFGDSPVLIICPKAVCNVWPDQLAMHGGIDPKNVEILEGTPGQRDKTIASMGRGEVLICNYEIARTHIQRMAAKGFAAVVCDESHRIKDLMSQTNRAVRKISASATYRWALSGTPAPNGPLDVAGTMGFLSEDILGVRVTHLRNHYAIIGGFTNHQIVGYKNMDELEMRVGNFSSRLLKTDAVELPPKTFITRPVELGKSAALAYEQIKKDAIARFADKSQLTISNVLSESMRLLQVCGGFLPNDDGNVHAFKPNAKIEALREVLDEIGDKQAIIWAGFVAEVKAIAAMLGDDCVIHYGGMNGPEREASIERFKSGAARYFVATPQSAREGITLTNADTVIYYSRTYNLLDWLQSQDRAHRIGQDKPVTIVSLVCEGTVENRVSAALERKADLQEMVLAGNVDQLF